MRDAVTAWLWYRVRQAWWRLDWRRGVVCGDLACRCDTCTTPGCECGDGRWLDAHDDDDLRHLGLARTTDRAVTP